ncbi:hypothetical protein DLE60_07930 [Micromonospora globispora]|nr:hypothetical protein DLE60_07930 [Micromonospora globispora]
MCAASSAHAPYVRFVGVTGGIPTAESRRGWGRYTSPTAEVAAPPPRDPAGWLWPGMMAGRWSLHMVPAPRAGPPARGSLAG